MTDKRGRGRPAKPPAERYQPWHITLPPDVTERIEAERQDGETDSGLITRLLRKATTMTYDEAFTLLCTGRAHPEWDERHHEARETVARAVWAVATEEGDGYGEMFDWIATGDFSPADLERRTAFTAAALAAEWDGMQRDAQNA